METNNRTQYSILAILFLSMVVATGILNYSDPEFFQRFLGGVNPLVAILISGVVGAFLLYLLLIKGLFAIYRKPKLKELAPYLGLVTLFAAIAIFIDWKIVFPADINMSFPGSLLFYPAIAFLVEMLFHVVPLSLIVFLLLFLFRTADREKLIEAAILSVAVLEPTYQVIFTEMDASWAVTLLWVNLFFFNITQLLAFKRHGFISMYLLRLLYYAIWHIVWGYFRLSLLF